MVIMDNQGIRKMLLDMKCQFIGNKLTLILNTMTHVVNRIHILHVSFSNYAI